MKSLLFMISYPDGGDCARLLDEAFAASMEQPGTDFHPDEGQGMQKARPREAGLSGHYRAYLKRACTIVPSGMPQCT
ncbi:hypothetical protein Q3C01_36115 [Bradyrhizobium sp. UFLA05-109]